MSFLANLLPGAIKGVTDVISDIGSGKDVGQSILHGLKSFSGIEDKPPQHAVSMLPTSRQIEEMDKRPKESKVVYPDCLSGGTERKVIQVPKKEDIKEDLDERIDEILERSNDKDILEDLEDRIKKVIDKGHGRAVVRKVKMAWILENS